MRLYKQRFSQSTCHIPNDQQVKAIVVICYLWGVSAFGKNKQEILEEIFWFPFIVRNSYQPNLFLDHSKLGSTSIFNVLQPSYLMDPNLVTWPIDQCHYPNLRYLTAAAEAAGCPMFTSPTSPSATVRDLDFLGSRDCQWPFPTSTSPVKYRY